MRSVAQRLSDFHSFLPFDGRFAHRVGECLLDAAVNFAEFPKNQEKKNSHQVKQELDCHRLIPPGPADFGNSRHSTTSFILLHALASGLKPSVHTRPVYERRSYLANVRKYGNHLMGKRVYFAHIHCQEGESIEVLLDINHNLRAVPFRSLAPLLRS